MKRGMAGMSKSERKRIASLGGIAAHKAGTAHKFSSIEGKLAGKKGAKKRWSKKSLQA